MKYHVSFIAFVLMCVSVSAQPILRNGWTTNRNSGASTGYLGTNAILYSSPTDANGRALTVESNSLLRALTVRSLLQASNVLIAPSNYATVPLQVLGNSGNSAFIVNSNGYVGVGTANPAYPLSVSGPNNSSPLLSLFNTTGEGASAFHFTRNTTSGTLSIQGLQIGFNNIVLAPTSGNVGIGTNAPASKLHVQDWTANADTGIQIGNDAQQWQLQTYGTGNDAFRLFDVTQNKAAIVVSTNHENMIVVTNGRVGIGRASPASQLHVNSDLRVGSSKQVGITPEYAGSGELPSGSFISGVGTDANLSMLPNSSGVSGLALVLGYYNGSQFLSALEFTNTASGYSTLSLMKSGGNALFGGALTVTSNLTWNLHARGMLMMSNSTASVSYTTSPWVVSNWTYSAALKNVTADTTAGTITLGQAGTYDVFAQVSYETSTQPADSFGEIYLDAVATGIRFKRDMTANNAAGSASCGGLVTATAGQVVTLRFSGSGTDDIVVRDAQLKVNRCPD